MTDRNPTRSRDASLKDGEIHVWKTPLAGEHDPSELGKLLDHEEQARAAAFARDIDRSLYVLSHGVLRLVLARYAGCQPRELVFERGVHQKPYLRRDAGMPDLHFSLSHTDCCALIAVRTSWPVGVDIERLRDLPDAKILASRWFTELENKALTTLSGASFKKAFFDLWTHREAVLKALGVDLETGVRGLEFSLGPNGSVRLISWRGDREIVRAWRVRRLRSGLDYRAALATLRHFASIRCFSWSDGVAPAQEADGRKSGEARPTRSEGHDLQAARVPRRKVVAPPQNQQQNQDLATVLGREEEHG